MLGKYALLRCPEGGSIHAPDLCRLAVGVGLCWLVFHFNAHDPISYGTLNDPANSRINERAFERLVRIDGRLCRRQLWLAQARRSERFWRREPPAIRVDEQNPPPRPFPRAAEP